MNYFDSNKKNQTYFLIGKAVMKMHVITKSTNLHVYSHFFSRQTNGVM